jgi:hypothetical protein
MNGMARLRVEMSRSDAIGRDGSAYRSRIVIPFETKLLRVRPGKFRFTSSDRGAAGSGQTNDRKGRSVAIIDPK